MVGSKGKSIIKIQFSTSHRICAFHVQAYCPENLKLAVSIAQTTLSIVSSAREFVLEPNCHGDIGAADFQYRDGKLRDVRSNG